MRRICLRVSLFFLVAAMGAHPVLAAEKGLTEQQLTAIRSVVVEYLLLKNGNPGPGVSADPANTSGVAVNGGDAGSTANRILVLLADGTMFNLTKLSASGQELPATADNASCVRDNLSGLIWEVKTNTGLHGQGDSFSWYDTTKSRPQGGPGFADNSGSTCSGYEAGNPESYCNTQAYVARVNTEGWCGYKDWRLPALDELKGIVSLSAAAPELYAGFFPRGTDAAVWSSSLVPGYGGFSWHIYLNNGYAHGGDQSGNLPVLLVRNVQP